MLLLGEYMRIICLMENTIGNELCQAEHGLSLYIEMKHQTILMDTGASGLFVENAGKLGVDLTKVETVFLSHGHYDHGGGILDFHGINAKAKIVMQKKAFGNYWHKSANVEKYIGLDSKIQDIWNLVLLDGNNLSDTEAEKSGWKIRNREENGKNVLEREEGQSIQIFTLKSRKKEELKCWPEGNLVLKEKIGNEYVQDNFEHEQYLVLKENGKSILISGCAHNGILNILEEYKNRYGSKPDMLISGFHMRKKNGYEKKDFEVIKEPAKFLKDTGILCYTGHCTGEEPFEVMKKIMGEQLQYLHCGDIIEIK